MRRLIRRTAVVTAILTGLVWAVSLCYTVVYGSLVLGYGLSFSKLGWFASDYPISFRLIYWNPVDPSDDLASAFGLSIPEQPYTAGWPIFPIPFALTLLAIALYPRHPARHCKQCGYDLRATPQRCPECGADPKDSRFIKLLARHPKSRTRMRCVAVIVAICTGAPWIASYFNYASWHHFHLAHGTILWVEPQDIDGEAFDQPIKYPHSWEAILPEPDLPFLEDYAAIHLNLQIWWLPIICGTLVIALRPPYKPVADEIELNPTACTS